MFKLLTKTAWNCFDILLDCAANGFLAYGNCFAFTVSLRYFCNWCRQKAGSCLRIIFKLVFLCWDVELNRFFGVWKHNSISFQSWCIQIRKMQSSKKTNMNISGFFNKFQSCCINQKMRMVGHLTEKCAIEMGTQFIFNRVKDDKLFFKSL